MANRLEIRPQGDRELVITRTFDAPRELVWRTLTEPALIQRWMLGPPGMSMPVCEVDLTVGGRYRYVWHKEGDPNFEMGLGGTFQEIEPPHRLVATELFDEDWTGGEALNTTVLTEQEGKTLLTTTMRYASETVRDGVRQTGMEDGMAAGYDRLDKILAEMPAG